MLLATGAVIGGLALLVWSADRFVEGAAAIAKHAGMPPLLIGMIIIGFGTSAPEMVVSAFSSYQGNPGLALGNAFGSNIANLGLILGITALMSPITVRSGIMKKELPLLTLITLFAILLLLDGELSRVDALAFLGVFFALMGWTVFQGIRGRGDALASEMEGELESHPMTAGMAILWLLVGLTLLLISSRILVWGAVYIAQAFGVSDLIIGLTIVAIGTSLPELASSIAASRKGEHDLTLGNVLGSNMFNTLVVVGIAGSIRPTVVEQDILYRDFPVMGILTISLFAIGMGLRVNKQINRFGGALLLLVYAAYNGLLISNVIGYSIY